MKEIAHAQGKAITFIAKWDFGLAGSSSHIHILAGQGRQERVPPEKSGPRGMSGMMQELRAGLLRPRGEITYFLAPYINSYKRFLAGTFAPTKATVEATIALPGSGCAERILGRHPDRMPHWRGGPQPLSRFCGALSRRASTGMEEKTRL